MSLCYNCFHDYEGTTCPFCGYNEDMDRGKYPYALAHGSVLGGRYIIGRVLGQGGFGITYVAQDYQDKKLVAIKEYFPEAVAIRPRGLSVSIFSGDREENFRYGKECFLSEAKTLAAFIGNRNIVRVYSYFEENNTAYFAMEYVEGINLSNYLKNRGGKISYEKAKSLLIPVMDALSVVHSKGIVHRDISPDNIYLTKNGTIKLIDFGAARYSMGDRSRSLDVVLKHGYAPMEQYTRRGRQGPFTDVYSLAATFYRCITGKIPPDSIDRISEDLLVPPSRLGVEIPPYAEEALMKALEVLTADRFQTMADFRIALIGSSAFQPNHSVLNPSDFGYPGQQPMNRSQLDRSQYGRQTVSQQTYQQNNSQQLYQQQNNNSRQFDQQPVQHRTTYQQPSAVYRTVQTTYNTQQDYQAQNARQQTGQYSPYPQPPIVPTAVPLSSEEENRPSAQDVPMIEFEPKSLNILSEAEYPEPVMNVAGEEEKPDEAEPIPESVVGEKAELIPDPEPIAGDVPAALSGFEPTTEAEPVSISEPEPVSAAEPVFNPAVQMPSVSYPVYDNRTVAMPSPAYCPDPIRSVSVTPPFESVQADPVADQGKKERKKGVVIASVTAAVLVLAAVGLVLFFLLGREDNSAEARYRKAVAAMDAGEYQQAIELFTELEGYMDSADKLNEAKYGLVDTYLNQGDYSAAISLLRSMNDSTRKTTMLNEANYRYAKYYVSIGEYQNAITLFTGLGTYQDSEERLSEARYLLGKQYFSAGMVVSAVDCFRLCLDYRDALDLCNQAMYAYALAHLDSQDDTTIEYLEELRDRKYQDSAELLAGLYQWEVAVYSANCDPDSDVLLSSIPKSVSYFHTEFELKNGVPGETITMYAITYWPDGNVYKQDWSWEDKKVGDFFGIEWKNGFTSSAGTLTIKVFNKADDMQLFSFSIKMT